MYCLCCEKKMFDLDEKDWNVNSIEVNCLVEKVEVGYGSKYDGDILRICICDNCLEEKIQKGTILYLGNYMGFSPDYAEENIKESKKVYNRRIKIDGII